MTALEGVHLSKEDSKHASKYIISVVLFFLIIVAIHKHFHRRLIDNGDEIEKHAAFLPFFYCFIKISRSYPIHHLR
jgi:uncharacterized membrane protein YoaK (UPF0700 family)